jgi:hypothetical protein
MIYHPDHVITFGANSGCSLEEIYRFIPSYLEWLIEYIPDFEIDITEFTKLPNPINLKPQKQNINGKEISLLHCVISNGGIKKAKQRPSDDFIEFDYSFPERILNILELKKESKYYTPKYEFAEINTISSEDFSNALKSAPLNTDPFSL